MLHALLSAALILLLTATPARALAPSPALQERVAAQLAAAVPGARFGLVVATADGRELIAIAPAGRFMPGSNTKLLTVAAAFHTLDGLDQPDAAGGASVRLDPVAGRAPDVVLTGRGDARLSGAADCATNCLATLADAVVAATRRVHDIVGDASFFPDERWSPGMSWNNMPTRSGTAIAALSLDDNELVAVVTPGVPGRTPVVALPDYYTLDNRAITVPAGGETTLDFDRIPGARLLRLTGAIAAGAPAETLRLGIDDPAHHAAWRFKALLEARGVRVGGQPTARYRPLGPADDPARRGAALPPRPPEAEPLARLVPPPLAPDLAVINKISQNLHAELMLRRVGRVAGTGSIADGLAAVAAMMAQAGVPRAAWDLSDGSGMSSYNRLSPRAIVTFLNWAAARPWGPAWRATLPEAAREGTLARRFTSTPLAGKLFAKTGSINASNALSGYMIAASGTSLTFSAFANDTPGDTGATAAIDAALIAIAAEY